MEESVFARGTGRSGFDKSAAELPFP